ncbi:MAG: ATP-binding protein, partial [Myxococcota bacterium]|nr:ATP-binding protein [Myxococcota bacterium]
ALELALQLAAHELRTRAAVVRRYAPLPPVRATLARLAHVFLELLRNAGESIPASMPHANSIHVVTKVDEDGLVSVEIADTGAGIDSCDMPYLFDPFFTTKREERAVGLGLCTAHQTIAELGGTLSVESLLGRGSRFRVKLPRASAFAEDALPDFSTHEAPPDQSVLCVGETLLDALRLGRLFGDRRVRVVYADVPQSFERLALGERFDLVVCDTRCAPELRSRVRRLAPDILGRVFEVAARESGPASLEAPAALRRRRRPLRLACRHGLAR